MIASASLTQLESPLTYLTAEAFRLCIAGLDSDIKRKFEGVHEDNKEIKKAGSQVYLSDMRATESADKAHPATTSLQTCSYKVFSALLSAQLQSLKRQLCCLSGESSVP